MNDYLEESNVIYAPIRGLGYYDLKRKTIVLDTDLQLEKWKRLHDAVLQHEKRHASLVGSGILYGFQQAFIDVRHLNSITKEIEHDAVLYRKSKKTPLSIIFSYAIGCSVGFTGLSVYKLFKFLYKKIRKVKKA